MTRTTPGESNATTPSAIDSTTAAIWRRLSWIAAERLAQLARPCVLYESARSWISSGTKPVGSRCSKSPPAIAAAASDIARMRLLDELREPEAEQTRRPRATPRR